MAAPMKRNDVVEGTVVGKQIRVFTTDEYAEYSKANGTYMGRPEGVKTILSPEEFVVLSREDWTPKMIMDKHGIDLAELQAVADKVPLIMQLKRRIVVTDKQIKW
jgi:hypothetical protein